MTRLHIQMSFFDLTHTHLILQSVQIQYCAKVLGYLSFKFCYENEKKMLRVIEWGNKAKTEFLQFCSIT